MSATWDSKSVKATPVSADELLIIDTEDSRNQKRALLSTIPVGFWSRNVGSGFIFPATLTDKAGVGVNSPDAGIHSLFTTEQLRLGFDASNFASFTVNSGGVLDIDPSGGALTIDGSTSNIDGSLDATAQNLVPIYDISDFPADVSGVITLAVNTMYEIRAPISTSNRFVLQNNTLMKGINSDQNVLTYTGTGTFFTATGITEDIQFLDMEVLSTGTGATLFSLQGTLNVSITFSSFNGFDNLGTLTDFEATLWREVIFTSFDTGVTFTNIQTVVLHTLTTVSNAGVSTEGGMVTFTGRVSTFISVDAFLAISTSPVDIFDISPTVNAAASMRINNVRNLGTGDFFTTGSTASISAFANADPASVSVTSVTDNSGVAVFTTTSVHGLTVEDVVIHTGFSESTYNGTFVVSTVTSTTEYEVTLDGTNVSFVATDTGTLQNKRVLVTSTSHGLSADTPVLITDTINYDAGYNIKDILTNSYEIQAVFVITETGNWSTGSLIETEIRVDVSHSSPQESSTNIGAFVATANTTDTTIDTQDVFVDLELDGSAIEASNIEKWTLIDTDTGELRYDGLEPFRGMLAATVTIEPNGNRTFSIRAVKNGSALPDVTVARIAINGSVATVPLDVPVSVVNGDLVRLQILEENGTTDPTITDCSVTIE